MIISVNIHYHLLLSLLMTTTTTMMMMMIEQVFTRKKSEFTAVYTKAGYTVAIVNNEVVDAAIKNLKLPSSTWTEEDDLQDMLMFGEFYPGSCASLDDRVSRCFMFEFQILDRYHLDLAMRPKACFYSWHEALRHLQQKIVQTGHVEKANYRVCSIDCFCKTCKGLACI